MIPHYFSLASCLFLHFHLSVFWLHWIISLPLVWLSFTTQLLYFKLGLKSVFLQAGFKSHFSHKAFSIWSNTFFFSFFEILLLFSLTQFKLSSRFYTLALFFFSYLYGSYFLPWTLEVEKIGNIISCFIDAKTKSRQVIGFLQDETSTQIFIPKSASIY